MTKRKSEPEQESDNKPVQPAESEEDSLKWGGVSEQNWSTGPNTLSMESIIQRETEINDGNAVGVDDEPREMTPEEWDIIRQRMKSNMPFPGVEAAEVSQRADFLRQEAIEKLTQSGVIVDADNSHRPVFRDGHLAHLAREFNRLGRQEAWRLYNDDLTVATYFYDVEFKQLVDEMRG